MTKRRKKPRRKRSTRSGNRVLLPAVARGLALFLGAFSALNILGNARSPHFNANHWWIDFRPVEPLAADAFLGLASFLLIAFAIKPSLSAGRRILTLTFTAALLIIAVWNTIVYYVLLAGKSVQTDFPVAFSIFVGAALATIVLGVVRSPERLDKRKRKTGGIAIALVVLILALAFPLGQIYCFGKTDYRRPADVIVVFGARVYANGRVSDALADRMRTGCKLYHDGLASMLILSGGPGDGAIHETQAMLAMAMDLQVPEEAIMLDAQGVSTQATVKNTVAAFRHLGIGSALAVSHFYHLPRIKMSYQRQGWEVYTVPAIERYQLSAMPKFILREIAALWVYYLRPLLP